ncbi:MAG: hypothetical protein KGZ82_08650 [Bacteroidales bacterium]|nr:hypothetical protein [Bacteroidales bacterium]
MRTLNPLASRTFGKLIKSMGGADHLRLNQGGEAIMPLSIERLTTGIDLVGGTFDIFSLSHYYEQNGDLVPDPDMTFAVSTTNQAVIIPLTFQNAIYYTRAIWHENDHWLINTRDQRDLTQFANTWLKNIRWQQNL